MRMRHEFMHMYVVSNQIAQLAYEIELRIQIDKENFMHDINQHEFKMDGQDKGRRPRGVFQEATQATAWGEKKTDMGQRPEILESQRALC